MLISLFKNNNDAACYRNKKTYKIYFSYSIKQILEITIITNSKGKFRTTRTTGEQHDLNDNPMKGTSITLGVEWFRIQGGALD